MKAHFRLALFVLFVFSVSVACQVLGGSGLTTIEGLVWKDILSDGIRQNDEPPLAGILVSLVSVNSASGRTTEVDSTTTGSDGRYFFEPVGGLQYYVEFEPPAEDWRFSPKDAGSDDSRDSDADPETGRSDSFFANEDDIYAVDAGLFVPARGIGDRAWVDANGNGIQDDGEEGLFGVRVNLYVFPEDEFDPVLAGTTLTDGNGNYHFDVDGGDYFLEFEPPEGFEFTQLDQGNNDALDSDADPVFGQTETFTVDFQNPNQDQWDAGFIPLGESPTIINGNHVPVVIQTQEGGKIVFNGGFEAPAGGSLTVGFTVSDADGNPAMGTLSATLGDPPSSPNASHNSGELDEIGMISLDLFVNWPPGSTKLYCAFNGVVYEVGEIRILP